MMIIAVMIVRLLLHRIRSATDVAGAVSLIASDVWRVFHRRIHATVGTASGPACRSRIGSGRTGIGAEIIRIEARRLIWNARHPGKPELGQGGSIKVVLRKCRVTGRPVMRRRTLVGGARHVSS
jgi:hypothetical protein